MRFPVSFLAVAGAIGGRAAFGAAFEGDGRGAGAASCARIGHDVVSCLYLVDMEQIEAFFTDRGVLVISLRYLARESETERRETERQTGVSSCLFGGLKVRGCQGLGPLVWCIPQRASNCLFGCCSIIVYHGCC